MPKEVIPILCTYVTILPIVFLNLGLKEKADNQTKEIGEQPTATLTGRLSSKDTTLNEATLSDFFRVTETLNVHENTITVMINLSTINTAIRNNRNICKKAGKREETKLVTVQRE